METRRAYLVEPKRFEIRELDVTPSPDEILLNVAACGLCNWELNHWQGTLGDCPMTLGHEFAGTVVETGRNVENISVGDAVACLPPKMEGFSDYVAVEASACRKLTDNVSPADALAEPITCVTNVVRQAAPEPGDVGVVMGCGPMGLWCIQALSGGSLSALVAVDMLDSKLALAKRFGATHTINPGKGSAEEILAGITDGRLADFVIEGTGIPDVLAAAMALVRRRRGRLAIMSSHESPTASAFDFRPVMSKGMIVMGTHPGISHDIHDDFRRAVLLLNNGKYKMDGIISHRFKLSDIQLAFETLENKPSDYIKGIVIPSME